MEDNDVLKRLGTSPWIDFTPLCGFHDAESHEYTRYHSDRPADNGSTLRLSATPILRETSAASLSETSQFLIFGDAVNFGSANARSVVARMVPG
jgi:hypothetical protein